MNCQKITKQAEIQFRMGYGSFHFDTYFDQSHFIVFISWTCTNIEWFVLMELRALW